MGLSNVPTDGSWMDPRKGPSECEGVGIEDGDRDAVGGGGEDSRKVTVKEGGFGQAKVGAENNKDDDVVDNGLVAGSVSNDILSEAAVEREVQLSDRARDNNNCLTVTKSTAIATSNSRSR